MSHNENSIADEGESWYGEFHPGGLGLGNFKLQPSTPKAFGAGLQRNSKLQAPNPKKIPNPKKVSEPRYLGS
jgi:hypothetical protein